MKPPPFDTALRSWLYGLSGQAAAELPDSQLLQRFVCAHDESAFAGLVQRHGPLVLGTCRRLLHDSHDAEDAFQATFLVLACRAASIRRAEALAGFLHSTAYRIACRLRGQKSRRQAVQQQAARQRPEAIELTGGDCETIDLLHEELNRLPHKYRDVLILCYLQGKTNEEAARALDYPLGSMSRHLSRARELLRERLLARGVSVVLGAALAEQARAAVPAALLCGTLDTVRRHALASALLAGSSPPVAVVLAQSIVRAAWMTRLTLASLVLAVGVALAGGVAVLQTSAEKQSPAQAKAPTAQPNAKQQRPQLRRDLYGDPLPESVLLRMGTARLRHSLAKQIVFAAEGKTLLSAGLDQTVRFWDVADGRLKRIQRMPLPIGVSLGYNPVAALSPDGKTLAQTTTEHLFLWNVATSKEIQRIPIGKRFGDRAFKWLTFSPDGKYLAGGDGEGNVLLWDVAGGKEKQKFKHKDRQLQRGAFAPDGQRLAVCGDDHLMFWELSGAKESRVIRLPEGGGPSNALIFAPDGQTVAYSNFMDAILWRVATGEREVILRLGFWPITRFRYYLAFAPDGKTLALGVDEGIVLWDRAAGKEIKRLKGYLLGPLCFSADGTMLASLHFGKIQLWDVVGGKQLQERISHDGAIGSIAFSPDGKLLASSSYYSDSIYLWDARSGQRVRTLTAPNTGVRQLAFSADGATLIAGGDFVIQMWDAASGKKGRTFSFTRTDKRRIDQLRSLHLSSDGKRLTVLGLETPCGPDSSHGDLKCSLTTWDAVSGERLARHRCPRSYQVTALSPDGKLAALPNGYGLTIHDITAKRDLWKLREIYSGPVAFSPDSRILAAGAAPNSNPEDGDADYRKRLAAEKVQLWDMTTGKELMRLDTGAVYWREFSPDGRYLVTAWLDGLHLWEIASGEEVLHHPAPEKLRSALARSFATSLTFAPDGRSVATGHADTNVLIWDMAPATRQPRLLSGGALDRVWTVLAAAAAARAYRAAGTLIADPQRAVPFLSERLRPVREDSPRIRKLIADLDSEQFTVRDAAYKELEKMDDAAHAVLRQALPKAGSLELRRRIESLLSVPFVVRSSVKLRQIRAVMVLEQIGDAAARRVLERLAGGTAEARQTREAKTALQRLKTANSRRQRTG